MIISSLSSDSLKGSFFQKITKKSHQSFPNAPDSFASCKEITLLPRHKHSTGNPKEGACGSVCARGLGVAVGTKQR